MPIFTLLIIGYTASFPLWAQEPEVRSCPPLEKLMSDERNSKNPREFYEYIQKNQSHLVYEYLRANQRSGQRWVLLELAQKESDWGERRRLLMDALKLPSDDHSAVLESELLRMSPSLIQNPPRELWLDVAKDWAQQREWVKAKKYYHKVFEGKFSVYQKWTALKGLRNLAKSQRKSSEHRILSQRVYNFSRKNNLKDEIFESGVYYSRVLWSQNRPMSALEILRTLEKESPSDSDYAEVQFIIGKIQAEMKRPEIAKDNFQKALGKSKDMKYLWEYVWNRYLNADYKEVIRVVKERENEKDLPERNRIRYWLGRSYDKIGETEKAKAIYKSIIDEDQFTFYAIASARELNTTIAIPKPTIQEPLESRVQRKSPEFLSLLNECGSMVADRYMQRTSIKYGSDYVLKARTLAGMYLPLFSNSQLRTELWNQEINLLFPTPYKEIVEPQAERTQVPPDWFYAIMRQESAFNPMARSPADARGLLQILPVHQRKKNLFEPQTNIYTGANLLKRLRRSYNNSLISVASAYNAGPNAVKTWKRNLLVKRKFKDPIAFIEEIPYEETRIYVKLVLRNQLVYSGILNDKTQVQIPEELFSL